MDAEEQYWMNRYNKALEELGYAEFVIEEMIKHLADEESTHSTDALVRTARKWLDNQRTRRSEA